MKKIAIISGSLTIILLILLLTGWAVSDDTVKRSIKKGNEHYNNKHYLNALLSYEKGLAVKSDHKDLNYNAAQAAYSLGDYEKALNYYKQSDNRPEKFINTGNIYYKTGEQTEDTEQKLQFYMQALQIYREGILNYPRNVELKYNYELIMEKIKQTTEQMEQEKKSQNQDQQDNDEQNNDKQDNDEEKKDNQDGQSEQNDQNQNESDKTADQDEQNTDMDQQAIERILQMLEDQERESLKNNQEIIRGKEGAFGW